MTRTVPIAALLTFSACAAGLASCNSDGDGVAQTDPTSGSPTDSTASGTLDATGDLSTGEETPVAEGLAVITTAELEPALREFVRFIPDQSIDVRIEADPQAAAALEARVAIAVVTADLCEGCYQLDSTGSAFAVVGGDILGAQYGLAETMEALGARFFSPHSTLVPTSWPIAAQDVDLAGTALREPEIAERGVQLHTLHTIEGLYAFWLPSPENLEYAKEISDWYVKQRVNFLQWVALDDILASDSVEAAWRTHTIAINDYAHDRGLRTGVNIQLFGSSNLQHAFDLLDTVVEEQAARVAMEERLSIVAGGTGFDHVTISFGEFSGVAADVFIASTNLVWDVLQDVEPGMTMGSVVHVGNYDDLKVNYMGQEYIFYLLAQFADPNIVPWIHSVMYYNLFDDAGGAYLHEEFVEHRALLLDRLAAGEDVGYFPETGYWVAFDNSVPTYLPVYMRSRWYDLAQIKERAADGGFAGLQRHHTFSSGFEWGYWQNDYATLRMNYAVPESWKSTVTEMFAPLGPDGEALSAAVIAVGDLQYEALIENRLAAYLAGRDAVIDLGDMGGIVGAPDRLEFSEVLELPAGELETFDAGVVQGLRSLADATEVQLSVVQGLTGGDPWRAEIADGLQSDVLRARFAAAVFGAAVQTAQGGDASALLDEAAQLRDAGRVVVARRHAALTSPLGARLLTGEDENPTRYSYGYLHFADTLCYWDRELAQATNVTTGSTQVVPPCFIL